MVAAVREVFRTSLTAVIPEIGGIVDVYKRQAWVRGEKALHLFSWDSVMDLLPCWILFGLARCV